MAADTRRTVDMTERELLEQTFHKVNRTLAYVRTISAHLATIAAKENTMALTSDDLATKLAALSTSVTQLIAQEAAEEARETNLPPAGTVAVPQTTLDALGAHIDQVETQVTTALSGQTVTPPATTTTAAAGGSSTTGSTTADAGSTSSTPAQPASA
jgi:hypothetical protein